MSTYAGGLAAPTSATGVSYAFENPNAVATDSFGNTYISTSYNCVFRLDANRNLSRVAGNCRTGFSGDGGNALNAQLNNPQGIALDADGNLYIADQGNQRIRQVTPAGIISTVAGNGTAGYSGDSGFAISAELYNPQGVVVDASGNLYIADAGNFRIRMVQSVATPGATITTIAGSSSQGTGGDGGPAAAATFTSPTNLARDSKGDLYITDTGASVVRMINSSGAISHIAGTGTPTYSGDGHPAVSAALNYPQGLALDAAGNLYIADRGNYRVRVIAVGGIITTYAGDGIFGASGDGGPATSAELFSPVGVATDHQGDLYIADQSVSIRMVDTSSSRIITTVAGIAKAAPPFYGDGGAAALANFATPWGIAFDSSSPPNMYVADWKNNRVRKITPGVSTTQAGVITTFAGNGLTPDGGDGGLATDASVTPVTLAVDSSGNVYLADNAVIRRIDHNTGDISTVTNTGLGSYLPGLAVDAAGQNIYVADSTSQVVRKIVISTGAISTFAGNGTAGYTGEGTATAVELNFPAGLAFDKNGNLYIADNGNCLVRMVSGGTITTVAGLVTNGKAGNCGSTGDSGSPTAAEINNPVALTVDGSLSLYIAQGNPTSGVGNTIRKVSAGSITTIAGNGTAGYSGDGGLATSAQLNNPSGLAVDSAGNVYVSDFANGAVRVLQPETEPLLTAAVSHVGPFPAGKTGTFDITVSNAALAGASSGPITVTATLPVSLTPTGMSGTNWSCSFATPPYNCTNSRSINGGQSLGEISLTVNVASDAPPQVTNQVVVSGGGALATGSEDLALSLTVCNVNGQTSVTVSDVQTIVNQALGFSKAANDINQDNVVNVVDIQIVINAALYATCTP